MPKRTVKTVKVLSKYGNHYYAPVATLRPETKSRIVFTDKQSLQKQLPLKATSTKQGSCFRLKGQHLEAAKVMSSIEDVSITALVENLIESSFKERLDKGSIPKEHSNVFLKDVVSSLTQELFDMVTKRRDSISIGDLKELEAVLHMGREIVSK